MDYDVESWVEEEARRGRGRRASHAPAPVATPFGSRNIKQPKIVGGGDFFGFAPPLPGAVPATPFTPGFGKGIGAFGKGADATPYATDAFLRRAPPTVAAEIPRESPPGDRSAMDDRGTHDNDNGTQMNPDEHNPDIDKDLETDDTPHERREEFAFADVLRRVRDGEVASREAAAAFEEACWERSFELREESASCVHRTVKAAELAHAADLLEAEAGTWSLVWFLLGDGALIESEGAASEASARLLIAERQAAGGDPASAIDTGVANPAPLPPPLSARVRMAARDENGDPVTFRLNRVVAWLEGTARAAVERERAGLVPTPDEYAGTHLEDFASLECAWRETATALDASATTDGRGGALCRALDPDGPARTSSALHPTSADAEDRLLRAAWRLTRGGMVDAARELCERAGQPWRSASLGGGAGFGPAPVGAVADDAFNRSAAKPVASALERAEAEADAGADPVTTRMALLTAVVDAARTAAAEDEDEEAASECERGGGAAKRALWKWACAETARQTSARNGVASYSRFESALYGAFAGDLRSMLGACDGDWESSAWAHFRALLDLRVDAAIESRDPGTPGPVLVDDDDDGLAYGSDKRKAGSMDDDGVDTDDVGAGLLRGFNQSAAPRWPTPEALAAVPPTAEAILDALTPLADHTGSGGRGEHRRAQGCLILGRTKELVEGNVLTWLFPAGMESAFDTDVAGGQLDEARVYAALADSPVRSPELLRFATHLLLFLRELLPDGGGLQPDGPLDKHLNAVVGNFVLHLSDAKRYALVPRYARHLRASLLVEVYARFLTKLAPVSSELKAKCLEDARAWIPREGDGGVRAIIVRALDDSREVVDGAGAPDAAALSRGPGHRERVLEWATLAGADLHPEAAQHACALIRQLCLQRSASARLAGADRRHPVFDPPDFQCGEERARRIVARLLPADLQANAATGGRPGAASELSDWAAYLAACAAVGAWRDLAAARDAQAAVDLSEGVATDDSHVLTSNEGSRLAAEAARTALDAILNLAAARDPDDADFYAPAVAEAFDPGVDGPGYWMDSPALVDADEAAMETEARSPTVRLVAVASPDRSKPGGGVGALTLDRVHETAAALAEALELRAGRCDDSVVANAMRCRVEVVRGCVGDGSRPEGAAGQILVEITADIDRLDLPVAPGTPPQLGAAYDAAAAAAAATLARARRELTLVAADAIKGDLPRVQTGRGIATPPPPLDVQSADGSDPEMIRSLCRAVCWPSLLLEGVEIEADLGGGESRCCELSADATRGLHRLFSARELTWMLHLQRQGEVNAIAAGARGHD